MQFRVLGPLRVQNADRADRADRADHDVAIPAGRVSTLLAVLVCHANQVVSVAELTNHLWGEPGLGAESTVRSYVRRLRAALKESDPERVFIRQRAPGYLLEVAEDEVDLLRFRALTRRASEAGNPREAAELYEAALALWRGTPLADAYSAELERSMLPVLEEEHARAAEARVGCRLDLGEHAGLVGELTELTRRYPLRERFWAQLMTALYRCGRQAEALDAYQRLRTTLSEELGIDPGAEVRELHQAVLGAEDRLVRAGPPVPRQLVADTPGFVGRTEPLRQLTAQLTGAARLAVVSGQPGAGKTAFAVHLAHRIAGHYPDGQLYADLRGFSLAPSVRPVQVLTRFARALGCAPEQIPDDLDELTALYRSLLDGKRMLVVLDDAATADDVRALLPGEPGCAVLVTSRNTLPGLVAVDGGIAVRLGTLSEPESVELLHALLSTWDGELTDAGARELAAECVHLPLALRIAAAHLLTRPGYRLTDLLGELRQHHRLDALAIPHDDHASVHTAFDLSYAALGEPARRLFGLLGTVPGPDFGAPAAAALAGDELAATRALLGELTGANLLESTAGGRYHFHDLLRAFAARQDEDHDDAASHRLIDYYLHTASVANGLIRRAPLAITLPPPTEGIRPSTFDSAQQALAWYEAERANLLALIRTADARDWHGYAYQLPIVLAGFYFLRKHWADWEETHRIAVTAARRAGDRRAEAVATHRLGDVLHDRRRYDEAIEHLETAAAMGAELGDLTLEAGPLNGLGLVHRALERYDDAEHYYLTSLKLQIAAGYPYGQAGPLANVARVYTVRGDFERAISYARRAIDTAAEYGDINHSAITWLNLGEAYAKRGDAGEAIKATEEALRLANRSGDRYHEAVTLRHLAAAYEDHGDVAAGAACRRRAAKLFEEFH
ncbi:BTAD domain-containing putative transcriptional regulator [Amycolatopsis lurida]